MNATFDEAGALETGVLRVYEIDAQAAGSLRDALETGGGEADEMATELLGAQSVKAERLDLIDIGDLTAITLAGYLAQGYDVPQEQLEKAENEVDLTSGWVLIVPSSALDGKQRLEPADALTPLAIFETGIPEGPVRQMPQARGGESRTEAEGDEAAQPWAEDKAAQKQRNLIILGAVIVAALVLILFAF